MSQAKSRPTGAVARLAPGGQPEVTSVTGGRLDVTTHLSAPGFNPLDLLYASLSACLVLSARIAASRFGVLDRLGEVRAEVTGEKAAEGPSRVARFHVSITVGGDLDAEMRQRIAEAAENEICTVSNTLRGAPEFATTLVA